jgi:hypothetical protein
MIIKDFDEKIGIHRTPRAEKIESNRLTLFFGGVEKIIEKGKPWDGSLGALLTGFPDNPHRFYSKTAIPAFSKKKDNPIEEIKFKEEEEMPDIKPLPKVSVLDSSKLEKELLKKHEKPSKSRSVSSDSHKKKHSKEYKRHGKKSRSLSSSSSSSSAQKSKKKRSRSREKHRKHHKKHHGKYEKDYDYDKKHHKKHDSSKYDSYKKKHRKHSKSRSRSYS